MNTANEIELAIKEHAAAMAKALEAQDVRVGTLQEHFRVLEQRLLEGALSGSTKGVEDGAFALAGELLRNPQVQDVAQKASTRTAVTVKASALLGLKNTVTGGAFFNAADAGIHTGLERRRFIRDFLNVVSVSQGSVSWTRETGFTNAAAIQAAEGDLKAESALTFELIDTVIPTLAHFVKTSSQALDDQPALLNLISGRMRYGLGVLLDDLIINGAATGWTVAGNHAAFAPAPGESGIDSISRAIALLEGNEAAATLVLLNPADYRALQRVKAASGDGSYLYGQPAGANGEFVWGVQVLPTTALPAGKMIVLDAARQGELYVREDARLDLGYADDDFLRNLLTARFELRALNVVIRPDAVIYGDLTAA